MSAPKLTDAEVATLRKIHTCTALDMHECRIAFKLARLGLIEVDDDHHFGAYLYPAGHAALEEAAAHEKGGILATLTHAIEAYELTNGRPVEIPE